MPTLDRKTRPVRVAKKPTAVSSADRPRDSRRLFKNQLVQVSLRLPKTITEVIEVEFEMPINELMANVLLARALPVEVAERRKGEQPTPRLRRAIASAEKIGRGRFVTAEDLFDALGEAAQS